MPVQWDMAPLQRRVGGDLTRLLCPLCPPLRLLCRSAPIVASQLLLVDEVLRAGMNMVRGCACACVIGRVPPCLWCVCKGGGRSPTACPDAAPCPPRPAAPRLQRRQ